MIRGTFSPQRGAVIPLAVRGADGSAIDVNAVVDTGFSAFLTLPETLARGLGLVTKSGGDLILADGSPRYFDMYSAEVLWDGAWIPVLASALGDDVLVGMRMVAGHRVTIDAVPGGDVGIVRLP